MIPVSACVGAAVPLNVEAAAAAAAALAAGPPSSTPTPAPAAAAAVALSSVYQVTPLVDHLLSTLRTGLLIVLGCAARALFLVCSSATRRLCMNVCVCVCV
jgi:hypothetical protein